MYSKQFIEEQKGKLLAEKEQIEKQLSHQSRRDKNVKNVEDFDVNFPSFSKADESTEEDVEAQEIAQYTDRLGVEAVLERKLEDINYALSTIEKGKYGKCDNCDGSSWITEERLKANPAARVCLKCENNKEKKTK